MREGDRRGIDPDLVMRFISFMIQTCEWNPCLHVSEPNQTFQVYERARLTAIPMLGVIRRTTTIGLPNVERARVPISLAKLSLDRSSERRGRKLYVQNS